MKDRFCLRKRSAPRGPHVITYSATLDVPADTATLLTELLAAERLRRGTGVGARAASCLDQAVLVLRWFREDTPMPTLARDAGVSPATGYRYLHEGIDALAAHAPDLHEVLEAGKAKGWTHVVLDGTLSSPTAAAPRSPTPAMTCGSPASTARTAVTCRSSATPTGSRSRSGDVQPGSTHDRTAARATGFLGALHAAAALLGLPTLADKGYAGAGAGIHTPAKGSGLHPDTAARNELIGCLRAEGERGIALLKTRWKALRRI